MNDGAAIRMSPTGTAQVAISVQTQGQGHETTFAQIVAHELGLSVDDVDVDPRRHRQHAVRARHLRLAVDAGERRRDRDRRAQGPRPRAARRRRDARGRARGPRVARRSLVASRAIRPWARRSRRSRAPRAARSTSRRASRPGLDAEAVYDPPNLTFPFGAYVCVVDIDPGTAVVKVRRFIAVDDCGVRINPMIVEGQIHGGLTDGDRDGADGDDRLRRGRQLPRRVADGLPDPDRGRGARLGDRDDGHAVAAPPDRRQGHRRVRHRRLPARDRQRHLRRAAASQHVDMPCTPSRVWEAMP